MIVSCSNGNLSHLITDDTGELIVEQAWKSHDYEPWITAFDLWRPDIVWSGKPFATSGRLLIGWLTSCFAGGDDLKLKQWDIRSPYSPISVNKA